MDHVICLSGARYSGKSYAAELLSKNLLDQVKPGEEHVHNIIVYESGELSDLESLNR